MSSDDGFKPEETSTGGEKLSAGDFWNLVDENKKEHVTVTLSADGSLEERLLVAQGHGLAPNLRRQLAFVGVSESVFEFQALGFRRYPNDSFDRSRAAHARGPDEAIAVCTDADGFIAHGIYLLPARLRAGVESRHASPGKWFDIPKGAGTTDSDIEARLILAVDFDVKRPSGISATEAEMQRSVRVALSAWSFLAHHLGEQSLAYLHSGNGRQIHIALDAVAVTDQSKNTIAGLLTGLAHLFNTPEVMVDEKLFDAKRILPACGTMKKKGASGVGDRPHRRTAIVTPQTPTRVPLEKLIELARTIWESADAEGRIAIEKSFGVKPQTTTNVTAIKNNPGSPFDLAKAVDPQAIAEWLGLYNARGEVVCPGCGETSGVAILNKGLKCHHNRCKDKGLRGFRNNVELVAEVHHLAAREAVVEIGERFGLDIHFRNQDQSPPESDPTAATTQSFAPIVPTTESPTTSVASPLPPLGEVLDEALRRACRRLLGQEKPIPLRLSVLNDHFGGGLWPGVHVICSSTGVGKTALGLQQAVFAAEAGIASAYIGLELRLDEAGMRILGDHAKVPWSRMYTGHATAHDLEASKASSDDLKAKNLPLHIIPRRAQGWPASKLAAVATAMRAQYPEEDGPGSRPIFLAVDFLQLVGPEDVPCGRCNSCRSGAFDICRNPQPDSLDIRERIARASYMAHAVAEQYDAVVWLVSSVARERYNLWKLLEQAAPAWNLDDNGRPIDRRIHNPDALVGLGKESGEIEYSADSVSAIIRVPDSWSGTGCDVVFATAKGRATGASWSPLRFTGFGYEDSHDGGMNATAVLEPDGAGDSDRQKRREQRQQQEDNDRATKQAQKEAAHREELSRAMEVVSRVVGKYDGVGSKQLRELVGAELKCGREKVQIAITACEDAGHIVVIRRNARDHQHYLPGRNGPGHTGTNSPEKRERGFNFPPHTPRSGAPHAPHVGRDEENESATPATPATPGKNKHERVAEAPATPATPRRSRSHGGSAPLNSPTDPDEDASKMLEAGSEVSDWHELATGLGWGHARETRARAIAQRRVETAKTDWQALQQAAARGEDPRAWATEQGWDDERIRIAEKHGGPKPPQPEGNE
jgi:hypothetical protein